MQKKNNGIKGFLLKLWNSPTVTTWGSMLSKALVLGVLLPLVFTNYSAKEAQIWLIFNTIASLQLLLDVGLTPTFSRIVAYTISGLDVRSMASKQKINDGEHELALQRVVSTMLVGYVIVGVLSILIIGVAGTYFLMKPISSLESSSLITSIWVSWVVVLIANTVYLVGNVFISFLQGTNNISRYKRWDIVFSFLSLISTCVVMLSHGGFLLLTITNMIWLPMSVARNYMLSKKLYKVNFLDLRGFDSKVFESIWPSVWRSGVGILLSNGLVHVSGLIYSQLVSVAESSAYLFALRIIQMSSYLSQAPFYTRIPILANYYAKGNHDALVLSARTGMCYAYWVYVLSIVSAAFIVPPFLSFIKSNTHFVSLDLWFLMGFAFLIERYGAMHIQLYSITNKIIWHIANGVTCILVVFFSFALYDSFHLYAFPLAVVLGYASFYSWYSAYHSYKEFNMLFISFEVKTILWPLVFFILSVGGWFLVSSNI